MNNVVEHLWQAEIKEVCVVNTVIKIKGEEPKSYFYSEKQKRVLRKKTYDMETARQMLAQPRLLLVFTKKHQKQVQIRVFLPEELSEVLKQNKNHCAVLSLLDNNSKDTHFIFRCWLNNSTNSFNCECLASVHAQVPNWRPQKAFPSFDKTALKNETIRICSALLQKIKVNSQMTKFSILMAANQQKTKLHMLWAYQLQWKEPSFYSISHELVPPQNKAQNKSKVTQTDEVCYVQKMQEKKQINKDLESLCMACERERAETEVDVEQVVRLRRKHGLSIVGITQQYYPVCSQCLSSMQQ